MKTHRKFPITLKGGVKIYLGKQKDGSPVYSVQHWREGKRFRQAFSDFEKAKVEADAISCKILSGDAMALQLNGIDRNYYVEAQRILEKSGIPLVRAAERVADAVEILGADLIIEAAKEYARRHPRDMGQRMVPEIVAELIEAKTKARMSDRHIGDLRSRLGAFAEAFKCPILTITSQDIRTYLENLDIAPRTFRNHLLAISNLYKFAIARRYLPKDHDALEGIEPPKDDNGEIEIFSPAELALIMEHARPEMVPYLAIGAFAGVRAAELDRLEWEDVHGTHIEIKAAKAKTAARRLIPIGSTLNAWLAPHRKSGKVVPYSNTANQITWLVERINEALEQKAKQDGTEFRPFRWKHNGLRHSWVSYRLAECQDVAKVALEAGNSAQMIFKHYRELVTPEEAKAWFAVKPDYPANVIFAQRRAVVINI